MSARYLSITPLQEPYDLGLDDQQRNKVQFNIVAEKTASTNHGFAEELIKILETADPVNFRSTGATRNIFFGTKAVLEISDGPLLSIIETSGTPPSYIQNQAAPAYLHPSALIVARASDYVAARTMARLAYDILSAVRNRTVTT